MKTYQSLIEIWTFQNNLGLNLYIMSFMNYKITILKKDLKEIRNYKKKSKYITINTGVWYQL